MQLSKSQARKELLTIEQRTAELKAVIEGDAPELSIQDYIKNLINGCSVVIDDNYEGCIFLVKPIESIMRVLFEIPTVNQQKENFPFAAIKYDELRVSYPLLSLYPETEAYIISSMISGWIRHYLGIHSTRPEARGIIGMEGKIWEDVESRL